MRQICCVGVKCFGEEEVVVSLGDGGEVIIPLVT